MKQPKDRNKDEQLFDDLNKSHFGGRFVRFRVVRAEASFKEKPASIPALGMCEPRKRLITLAYHLSDDFLRKTLLHEMCHIGTLGAGYQHGKSFRRHLHSLLRKGEKWAWSEIEYYRLQESELLIQKKKITEANKRLSQA